LEINVGSDKEAEIRERAYAIWEQEGRPTGNEMKHWLQAWQEIETGEVPNEDIVTMPYDRLGSVTPDRK
jgi:hypothetical protein